MYILEAPNLVVIGPHKRFAEHLKIGCIGILRGLGIQRAIMIPVSRPRKSAKNTSAGTDLIAIRLDAAGFESLQDSRVRGLHTRQYRELVAPQIIESLGEGIEGTEFVRVALYEHGVQRVFRRFGRLERVILFRSKWRERNTRLVFDGR